MIVLEVITSFVIEVIYLEFILGMLTRVNNGILKLRGIETRSLDEIKFEKLRRRYEYKRVVFISNFNEVEKASEGIVLELTDKKNALVEMDNSGNVIHTPIRVLRIKSDTRRRK